MIEKSTIEEARAVADVICIIQRPRGAGSAFVVYTRGEELRLPVPIADRIAAPRAVLPLELQAADL